METIATPEHTTCHCGGASATDTPITPVYTIGKVEARFPSIGLEKEFAQAIGRDKNSRGTNQQAFHSALSHRPNRYLARRLCWIFSIEGLPTYVLQPREECDYDILIESIRPQPTPLDVDVLIGLKGPIAPPQLSAGLNLPIVVFDQIHSFDREGVVAAIPRPHDIPEKRETAFRASSAELFERILQMADNTGHMDEHRALNYLAVRYPAIYARAAESHGRQYGLSGIEVRLSRLAGARKIYDVIFVFTHRENDVTEKYFTRVDVTEEFPFLVTKLSPYYDR